MPPPSTPEPIIRDSNSTTALLQSLERARDSLAARVEQLSHAVVRLREQAVELERVLNQEGGDTQRAETSGRSAQVTSGSQDARTSATENTTDGHIVPSIRRRITPYPSGADMIPTGSPPTQPSAHRAPSAIRTELENLGRPITSDEIASLLDRASRPIPIIAGPPVAQIQSHTDALREAEEVLQADINSLRERARAALHGPRQPDSDFVSWVGRTEPRLREGSTNPGNPTPTSGSLLAEMIHERERRSGSSPNTGRTPSPRPAISSRISPFHTPRRGMTPTNLATMARTPEVVRSTPNSPAPTSQGPPCPTSILDLLADIDSNATAPPSEYRSRPNSVGPSDARDQRLRTSRSSAHQSDTESSVGISSFSSRDSTPISSPQSPGRIRFLPPPPQLTVVRSRPSSPGQPNVNEDLRIHVTMIEVNNEPEISHHEVTPTHEVVLDLPSSWTEPSNFHQPISPSTSTAPATSFDREVIRVRQADQRQRDRQQRRQAQNDGLTARGRRVQARIESPSPASVPPPNGPRRATHGHIANIQGDESFLDQFPLLRELIQDDSGSAAISYERFVPNPSRGITERRDNETRSWSRHQEHAVNEERRQRTFGPRGDAWRRTVLSPMDEEIRAIQREEGEHLRALAHDIVRSRPNTTPNNSDRVAENRRERERIMLERVRQESGLPNLQTPPADQGLPGVRQAHAETQEWLERARRARREARRTMVQLEQSLAPIIADLDRQTSEAIPAPAANPVDRVVRHRVRDVASEAEGWLSDRAERDRLEATRESARASIGRSRNRMRELAEIRRHLDTVREGPLAGPVAPPAGPRRRNVGDGSVDLAEILNLGDTHISTPEQNDSRETPAARRASETAEVVYEGSGERATGQRNLDEAEADEDIEESPVRGDGTAGTIKDVQLDAHLWSPAPPPAAETRPSRPYISMLDL